MTAVAHLILPVPISSNNLFSNVRGRGRVSTTRYRKWRREAKELLRIQGPLPHYSVPVSITYLIGEAGVGLMDAGNAEKAYTDALVGAGVLVDDSRRWVRSVAPQWVPGMSRCVAVIQEVDRELCPSEIALKIPEGLRGLLQ